MTSSTRKTVYAALAALNVLLFFCAHQKVYGTTPAIALAVSYASLALSTFMHAWNSPEQPALQAALAAAQSLVEAPPAPNGTKEGSQ